MDETFGPKIEHLQLRLVLLRELADSLAEAQAAVLRSDLGRVQMLTARQREVCGQYLQIACPGQHVPAKPEPGSGKVPNHPESADGRQRWNALTAEIVRMERKTFELNQAYGALLRRARRTVDIFCRALASSSLTYGPPPQSADPFAYCSEEVERV